jgi:hypothetical protein
MLTRMGRGGNGTLSRRKKADARSHDRGLNGSEIIVDGARRETSSSRLQSLAGWGACFSGHQTLIPDALQIVSIDSDCILGRMRCRVRFFLSHDPARVVCLPFKKFEHCRDSTDPLAQGLPFLVSVYVLEMDVTDAHLKSSQRINQVLTPPDDMTAIGVPLNERWVRQRHDPVVLCATLKN